MRRSSGISWSRSADPPSTGRARATGDPCAAGSTRLPAAASSCAIGRRGTRAWTVTHELAAALHADAAVGTRAGGGLTGLASDRRRAKLALVGVDEGRAREARQCDERRQQPQTAARERGRRTRPHGDDTRAGHVGTDGVTATTRRKAPARCRSEQQRCPPPLASATQVRTRRSARASAAIAGSVRARGLPVHSLFSRLSAQNDSEIDSQPTRTETIVSYASFPAFVHFRRAAEFARIRSRACVNRSMSLRR